MVITLQYQYACCSLKRKYSDIYWKGQTESLRYRISQLVNPLNFMIARISFGASGLKKVNNLLWINCKWMHRYTRQDHLPLLSLSQEQDSTGSPTTINNN